MRNLGPWRTVDGRAMVLGDAFGVRIVTASASAACDIRGVW